MDEITYSKLYSRRKYGNGKKAFIVSLTGSDS